LFIKGILRYLTKRKFDRSSFMYFGTPQCILSKINTIWEKQRSHVLGLMPACFDEISTPSSLCCHHPFASESRPYLQKGDDTIIMIMLRLRQKIMASFKPRK